jgi:hypothetical protein
MPDLDKTHQLLLMAAAVHNLGPELGSRDRLHANAHMVIGQALHWAGFYDERVRFAFQSYQECPEIAAFYDALISMMPQGQAAEPLFEGNGNILGDPRASPFFNHCRLTESGLAVANELLNAHPEYRNDLWHSS